MTFLHFLLHYCLIPPIQTLHKYKILFCKIIKVDLIIWSKFAQIFI